METARETKLRLTTHAHSHMCSVVETPVQRSSGMKTKRLRAKEREKKKKRKQSLYLHRVAALARWLRVEKLVFFKYTDGTVNILHRPFRTRSRRRVFAALKLEGFSFKDELSFFSLFYKEVEVYKSFSKWAAKNHNKVAIRNGISIPPTLWPHLHAIFPWLY